MTISETVPVTPLTDAEIAKVRMKWAQGFLKKSEMPEYYVWKSMVHRCINPKCKDYLNYGGRGIEVCPRWRNDFWAFLQDVGYRPQPWLTLDRINNNGDYEPLNVRWATRDVQAANQRKENNVTGKIGEARSWAILNEAKVIEIRRRAAEGERQVDLGREFGVAAETIRSVITGRSWPHLPHPRATPGQG